MIVYIYIGVFLSLICTTILKSSFKEFLNYLNEDEVNVISKSPNLFIILFFIVIVFCWPLILIDIMRKL